MFESRVVEGVVVMVVGGRGRVGDSMVGMGRVGVVRVEGLELWFQGEKGRVQEVWEWGVQGAMGRRMGQGMRLMPNLMTCGIAFMVDPV